MDKSKGEKINWEFLSSLPPRSSRIIVLDTETTGLNHLKNHIIELAACEILNGKITGQNFHFYIKPRVPVEESAYQVNHIKETTFAECYEGFYPDEGEQMKLLLNFIGDSFIFCHNAVFDYYFLTDELVRLGLAQIPRERFRCSMRVMSKEVKARYPELKMFFKLGSCCDFFKLRGNDMVGEFNSAVYDTFMCAKLVIRIYDWVEGKIGESDLDLDKVRLDIKKMKKEAQEKKEVKTKEDIDINDITQQIANLLKIRVPKKEEDNKV